MNELESINAEIEQLKERFANVKGSRCEVYSRIVGYYRPVDNWNGGKREEFTERTPFKVPA